MKKLFELTSECSFMDIFEGPQKTVNIYGSIRKYPEDTICYSRSYYRGGQWTRDWFECSDGQFLKDLGAEIDACQENLMALPWMRDFESMAEYVRENAQPTTDNSAFNLFAETKTLRMFLRFNTIRGDYNLYVYFYKK